MRIAKSAKDDFDEAGELGLTVIPDLSVLAGLGTDGLYPNHMNSELIQKLTAPGLQPFNVAIPLKDKTGNGWSFYNQSLLLPHETFAAYFHVYPEAWRRHICPSTAKITEFWQEMEENPQFLGHPVRDRETFRTKAIPIGLHGDGVPVTGVGKAWAMYVLVVCREFEQPRVHKTKQNNDEQ